MSEIRITPQTTLKELQDFAKTVKDGHELRAKTKDGVVKLYSKDPNTFTLNTKAKERPEKFQSAREAIRGVLERNSGESNIDRILSGIAPRMGGHRQVGGLTGAKLKETLDTAIKSMEGQQRAQKSEDLAKVDTKALLGRSFNISGGGSTGVIFARKPGEQDVVLKFEGKNGLETTDRLFTALDTISGMPGELPFDYGRHMLVKPGNDLDTLHAKLDLEFREVQSRIQDIVKDSGVDLGTIKVKGQDTPLQVFLEDGTVHSTSNNKIKQALRGSPEVLETYKKLEGALGRMLNMKNTLESEKEFSQYSKHDGQPIEKLSVEKKGELLEGSQFPRDMGKGGMLVSMLGMNDHCGAGIANLGNFLISDSGKIQVVDITANTKVHPDGSGDIMRGMRHDTMVTECQNIVNLVGEGKLEKTLQDLVDRMKNGEIPDDKFGGVGRFAQATLGPSDNDRLFGEGQDEDRQQVLDGMKTKDQVRLLANYLLGSYEGMKQIVENKDQFKQVILDSGMGIGSNGKTPDPDQLLDDIERAFNQVTDKQLQKLMSLAK